MRMIALAVAATLVGATATFAQVTPPAVTEPVEPGRATSFGFIEFQAVDELLVTNLLGLPVRNLADETVGTVNNILYSYEGEATAIIMSVGGFLGIGVKNVAIAYDAITITEGNNEIRLVVDASREAIDAAPPFQTLDELDIAPMIPADRAAAIQTPAAEAAAAAPEPAPAAAAPEPAPAPVVPAEPVPAVTPEPAPAAPVEPAPMAPVEPAPVAPAEPAAVTPMPAPAPTAAVPAAPVDAGPMVITAPPMVIADPMGTAPTTYLATQGQAEVLATEMIGHAVVNLQGETLGNINQLLQTRDGTIVAVIVGVGGFLGMGVKDVAISRDRLNIGVIDGEWRFVFNADRTTLEAAPAFQRLP